MQDDWKEEVLEQAVSSYTAHVTAGMEAPDIKTAVEIYRALFQLELDNLGRLPRSLAEPVFEDLVQARTERAQTLPLEKREQLILEDDFFVKVLTVDREVERTARAKLAGQEPSREELEAIDGHRAELLVLSQRLRREFPDLETSLGERLSDAQLDCMYLLEGGKPMSLRLNRV